MSWVRTRHAILNLKRNLVLLVLDLCRIDSWNRHQLIKVFEIAILLAVMHDCLSLVRWQSKIRLQFLGRGLVDVDPVAGTPALLGR